MQRFKFKTIDLAISRQMYTNLIIILMCCMWTLINSMEEIKANNEFLIETETLPENLNLMPTLSNGHLGFTVWGDAIFMNGIYNGAAGNSRRARIPNWLNISATIVGQELPTVPETTYRLDMKGGYFSWQLNYIDMGILLEQRTYAHRYFNRALIYELLVKRSRADTPLLINLSRNPGSQASEAFVFTPIDNLSPYKYLKAVTRTVENLHFQQQPHTVFIVFSENYNADAQLRLSTGEKELNYRFILAADENLDIAMHELAAIQSISNWSDVFRKHTQQWHNFWHDFSIDIKGNSELSKIVNAGLFYLSNSLPALCTNQANSVYYGLSPTGLGRGNLDEDYEGHNFWDTEMWMLPVITQCSISWAESLLQYRLQNLAAAKYNAQITGYQGARYPWESAFTGTEVTNPDFPEVAEQQVHISADIVLALRQHFAVTNDQKWLCQVAWPIAREVALYLESRMIKDETDQKYHVKDVMGPDEDHENVDDNVYTNVIFKMALQFASEIQETCAPDEIAAAARWLEKSNNIFINYDAQKDYHPEHVGYQLQEIVKQADVILLGYPLQYNMNNSTRLNDLHFYEKVTRASGPAMTWSMFSINYLDVHEISKAAAYFAKSYEDYVDDTFKVWSEVTHDYKGASNFLTGVGGFLQAIINGYAGLRYQRMRNKSVLEIRQTQMLANCAEFSIKGIKFAGARFMLRISNNQPSTLTCLQLGEQKLISIAENVTKILETGSSIIANTMRLETITN